MSINSYNTPPPGIKKKQQNPPSHSYHHRYQSSGSTSPRKGSAQRSECGTPTAKWNPHSQEGSPRFPPEKKESRSEMEMKELQNFMGLVARSSLGVTPECFLDQFWGDLCVIPEAPFSYLSSGSPGIPGMDFMEGSLRAFHISSNPTNPGWINYNASSVQSRMTGSSSWGQRRKESHPERIRQNLHTKTHDSHPEGGRRWKSPIPPTWLHHRPTDKLSNQVVEHFKSKRQSEELCLRKFQLRDELYGIISGALFPKCGLYIVGSSMNGLGAEWSDMDLCLMITNDEICQRTHAVEILHQVAELLERWDSEKGGPKARSQQLILAKVPILRVQFEPPFQDIQVDLNANNAVAIKNTHLLYYYTSCDVRLRPLMVAVKEWARKNGINDAFKSTLSSYSLVLMVIHYLQAGMDPPVLPNLQTLYPEKFGAWVDARRLNILDPLEKPFHSGNTQPLGELLLGFFRYYAKEFDFNTDAVSVRCGRKLSRWDLFDDSPCFRAHLQWRWLCIEEPFTGRNTAQAVYDERAFEMVKDCFGRSFKDLGANGDFNVLVPEERRKSQEVSAKPSPVKKNGWTYISYQDLCGGGGEGGWESFNKSLGLESIDSGCSSETGLLRPK